jgi:hypothetical protein
MATESVPVTVEVLTKALQNTSAPWYSSGPVLALLGVLVGALVGFAGNWYLKRMDRDSWLQQRRWELKWQCYSQLAEHYGELSMLISEHIGMTKRLALAGEDRGSLVAEENRLLAAMRERFEPTRRYGSIARIVVPPHVRTFLTNFAERWNATPHDNAAQGVAAWETWNGILDHARADLGLEALEGSAALNEVTR